MRSHHPKRVNPIHIPKLPSKSLKGLCIDQRQKQTTAHIHRDSIHSLGDSNTSLDSKVTENMQDVNELFMALEEVLK